MKIKNTILLLAGLVPFGTFNIKAIMKMKDQVSLINQNSGFTGKWKLIPELSEFGKMPIKYSYSSINVLQTEDSVTVVRVSDVTTKQTLPLNGKSSSIYLKTSNRTKTSTISWIENGKVMKETAIYVYYKTPIQAYQLGYTETWTLSSKGKTLTIARSTEINDPKLNHTTKAVYQKI